jgi:glycosyltransferase involved in cell wall biosynthesis
MNLLIISRCPPLPLHLGDRLLLYHVVRHMVKAGDQIDLLAYYDDPADPRQVATYAPLFRAVDLVRDPPRTMTSYLLRLLNPTGMFPRMATESWSATMWHMIRQALTRRRFDAVLLFGGVQVYEFRALVRRLPTVIVPYESYSLYLRRAATVQATTTALRVKAALQRWAAEQYERRMFTGFRRVVLISEVDAAHLRSLNPRYPLSVITSGVDHEYFTPPDAPATDPTLIFFGNLAYPPNADAVRFLVESIFPLVRDKVPGAKLLVVGPTPPPGLHGEGVEVMGRVPDLRPYLARSQVFICPLRFGAGIKNKMLEAMAMARPIVASPLSCDGFEVVPGHHVLLGTTAAELADAAIRVLQDADLRQRMGAANRALVEAKYAWERAANAYRHVIQASIQEASQEGR